MLVARVATRRRWQFPSPSRASARASSSSRHDAARDRGLRDVTPRSLPATPTGQEVCSTRPARVSEVPKGRHGGRGRTQDRMAGVGASTNAPLSNPSSIRQAALRRLPADARPHRRASAAGSVRGETETELTLIDANKRRTVVKKSDVSRIRQRAVPDARRLARRKPASSRTDRVLGQPQGGPTGSLQSNRCGSGRTGDRS